MIYSQHNFLMLVAVLLFAVSAFIPASATTGIAAKVNLFKLAWAFFALAFVF